jgi:hypothetical protein
MIVLMSGCTNKNAEKLFPNNKCDTSAVTFLNTIQPILDNNCVFCHSGPDAHNGVHLDSYAGVKAVVDNGLLYNVLNGVPFQMPPTGRLDNCTIFEIKNWIDKGSLNN